MATQETATTAAHHGAILVLRTDLQSERPVTLSLLPDEVWGGFELRLQQDGDEGWLSARLSPIDSLQLARELISIDPGAVRS